MPSVGSTPTTTSPAQQLQSTQQQTSNYTSSVLSYTKLPQKPQIQRPLPLQLQYQVTTTQPAPAGVFTAQNQNQSQSLSQSLSQSVSSLNCATPSVLSGVYGGHPQISASSTSNIFSNNSSNTGGDVSPVSSTGSFSSADTNQTLLNTIIHKQQPKATVGVAGAMMTATSVSTAANSSSMALATLGRSVTPNSRSSRSYQTKYGQFMIVTPAVSIDRDFEQAGKLQQQQQQKQQQQQQQQLQSPSQSQHLQAIDNDAFNGSDDDRSYYRNERSGNGNLYRNTMLHSNSSVDSGNSSDSGSGGSGSFRSAYNPYLHTSRQHLLPKSAPPFCTFSQSTWRWCTLLCAAMRCFGTGNAANDSGHSSFIRPPYYRSRSTGLQNPLHASGAGGNGGNGGDGGGGGGAGGGGGGVGAKTLHHRLRSYSTSSFTPETAFEHFSAPFKSRKTRDQLNNNNITYEL